MTNPLHPLTEVTKLHQVCIVVHDIDKSVASMWENFGIGPWDIINADADTMSDTTYMGKPARFGFQAALTQKLIGGIELELIQPTMGESTYRDFLNEYGEGVHHIGHHKIDTYENLKITTKALEAAVFPCVMSGRTVLGAFSYMDTRKVLNTILEMAWDDPSATPPPRAYVYPA